MRAETVGPCIAVASELLFRGRRASAGFAGSADGALSPELAQPGENVPTRPQHVNAARTRPLAMRQPGWKDGSRRAIWRPGTPVGTTGRP